MRSIKGPTVIYPSFLNGVGAEYDYARKAYYLSQLKKYIVNYEAKLVKSRARTFVKRKENK